MILTILFIILAAICKAFVDTIVFHDGGIFHNHSFFDINHKGVQVPFTKYTITGFHVFNSLMIIFFVLAICFAPQIKWYFTLIGGGIVYNLVFNYFFNKLLN